MGAMARSESLLIRGERRAFGQRGLTGFEICMVMRANGWSATSAVAPRASDAINKLNASAASNFHSRDEDVNKARGVLVCASSQAKQLHQQLSGPLAPRKLG
jgi:hypothetical protein